MNSSAFQSQNETRWRELEQLLNQLDDKSATPTDAARLPELFRQVCGDLSLAQHRMYGLALCQRLNLLVIRGYNHVHRESSGGWMRIAEFFWFKLPRLVRAEWKLFWLCQAFFWIPFTAMLISSYHDPRWVQSVLGPESMAQLEAGFGEGQDISEERNGFANFMMFGFYVWNNVKIDIWTFAGGILFGVGTLIFLLLNGVLIGAQTGYVIQACDPANFTDWISGHSYFELTGMILAGMAGFRIGWSIVRPGRQTRKQALVDATKPGIALIIGAMTLTFIAAIIEGFWSPLPFHPLIKYAVGIALTLLLSGYLLFAGRAPREA